MVANGNYSSASSSVDVTNKTFKRESNVEKEETVGGPER